MNTKTEVIQALEHSCETFIVAANAFPRDKRTDKPDAVAFSATEILYHMIDVDKLWQQRVSRLLSGKSKEFIAMDPDKVAIDNAYNSQNFETGIADLRIARQMTLSLFRSMRDEQFELVGMHTKYGEMSINRILEIMTNHDLQHTKQLDRTEQQLNAMTR